MMKQRGFSIVEMLVALAVYSCIAVLATAVVQPDVLLRAVESLGWL